MNPQDRELLNTEAKLIHQSDRTEALILLSLETIYNKGQIAGMDRAIEAIKLTGE